jgi:UDP-glucose 4-epimerase
VKILVTGGAGYIGSHTVIELQAVGHEVVVVDNLVNADLVSLKRVERITGKAVPFVEADIRDREAMEQVCQTYCFDCCIHFAGFKAVGESVLQPWKYYDNNITGTLVLLDVLGKSGCKNLIFSSSAAVYGEPETIPVTETCPRGRCANPYARSKSIQEQIMMDMQKADPEWNIVLLRYFNPIGAHRSGMIGEDPKGIPNNLMPYITQVAVGKLEKLSIFGDDYDTVDGTGVRDYIHVVDLAKGHVKVLDSIAGQCGLEIFNLGTGVGYSVLDVVRGFEKANNVKILYEIKERRAGDIAVCYSDPGKAERMLGWKAEYGLEDMCRDSWNWQKRNPNGFTD